MQDFYNFLVKILHRDEVTCFFKFTFGIFGSLLWLFDLERLTGPWPASAMRALVPALVDSSVQGAGTSSTMGVW